MHTRHDPGDSLMYRYSKEEMYDFLNGQNDQKLFALAAQETELVFGKEVYLRAIVEFSNYCNKRCKYCGLRAPNKEIHRYRMSMETILDGARAVADNNIGTLVLQSGDDFQFSTDDIGELIKQIRSRHDLAITLSVGDRGIDEYVYWRTCGADRCLLKIETSNPDLYEHYRAGEPFDERLNRVQALKEIGYEVGSGTIIGLPGMNIETTLADILTLTDLELDMIAVGPFIPNPQTPFANAPIGSIELSHRATALLRLLNPGANIPATSALSALKPESQRQALLRGCNVLMPSVTPEEHRGNYTIYPGKNRTIATATELISNARELILSAGLIPSSSKGFSKRNKHHVK